MRQLNDLLRAASTLPGRTARVAESLYRRVDAEDGIVPADAARGVVGGPDPERIVVIGENGMISLGVRTHGISLTASLARQHAARTGRGVVWSSAILPGARIRDAPAVIARLAPVLARTDAVVLLVGVSDVLRVTAVAHWGRHLGDALAGLRRHLPAGTWILVAALPPLDHAGGLSPRARRGAGRHGRALDQRTREVVASVPNATAIAFPAELMRAPWQPACERTAYRETYRIWGADLARALGVARSGREPGRR
jgi:hypothetical protein